MKIVALSACKTPIAPTLSAVLNRSHEASRLLSHHHLHQLNFDMGFRNPFSRLKKVKHRLIRSKHTPENPETSVGGSRLNPPGSRPSSEPHVVASGSHVQEGDGANTDGGRDCSAIRLPQPNEPGYVPAHGSATGSM